MTVRQAVPALAAALFAALVLPLLFIGVESAVQGSPIVAKDFPFAYTLVAPFALTVGLAVAWPSYRLLPERWPRRRRLLAASLACVAVPVAAFLRLADDFPWKAGLAGLATFFVWAWAYHLAGRLVPDFSIRSEPSG